MDALPPFRRTALFLDMDGTLIELAATPDAVVVAPALPDTLASLREKLDGAVAIVTGRPIDTVDRLLGAASLAVAGEHGGALRFRPDDPVERPDLPAPPAAWLNAAESLARAHPGALVEYKVRGFGIHFRLAPEAGPALLAGLQALIAEDPAFHIMPGLMLWEVRPVGADKGGAVDALMQRAPFAGRVPVFIGDDVTDEDGMRASRALGGSGYRVQDAFGAPEDVRTWLSRSAEAGNWAKLPLG
jgi:trehalose 6-phosphate phosphatase